MSAERGEIAAARRAFAEALAARSGSSGRIPPAGPAPDVTQPMPPPLAATTVAKVSAPTGTASDPGSGKNEPATRPAGDDPAQTAVTYEDIRPIFESACFTCHGADLPDGGLDLSDYRNMMKGGGSGAVVVPFDAKGSRLYRLIAREEMPFMPKNGGKMSDADLEKVRRFIDGGAPRTRKDVVAGPKRTEPAGEAARPTAETATVPIADFRTPPFPAGPADRRLGGAPIRALAADRARGDLYAAAGERILRHRGGDPVARGVIESPVGVVEALATSRDGALLLVAGGRAGKSGAAALYDLEAGRLIRRFAECGDSLFAAAISPGKTLCAVGGADRKVRVYLVATGELLYTVNEPKDWVLALAFSPDGNYLAIGDRAGGLYLQLADSGRAHLGLRGHEGPVNAVAFRPDAGALASVGDDGILRLFELEDGKEIRKTSIGDPRPGAIAWLDEKTCVTGGSDGKVRFHKANGDVQGTSPALGEWVMSLALDPSGTAVIAGVFDGRVIIIDRTKRTVISALAPATPPSGK